MLAQAHTFADADAYERFMGPWSVAAAEAFLQWVAPPAHLCWLDVGCGTGSFTRVLAERCHPRNIVGIDPEWVQLDRACSRGILRPTAYLVANAQDLPFARTSFDCVASALVLNFVDDLAGALAEMRRVVRPGGMIMAYVWDFENERSPSGPVRLAMKALGHEVPPVPGTRASDVGALHSCFETSGFVRIATTVIDVTAPYATFEEFWDAQTSGHGPITRLIAAMSEAQRDRLRRRLREGIEPDPDGTIRYAGRINAVRGTR